MSDHFEQLIFTTLNENLDQPEDETNNLYKNFKNSSYFSPEEFNNLSTSKNLPNGFSFIHLNINRLNCHFDDFLLLLQKLNHKFSIICLTETWTFDDSISSSLTP